MDSNMGGGGGGGSPTEAVTASAGGTVGAWQRYPAVATATKLLFTKNPGERRGGIIVVDIYGNGIFRTEKPKSFNLKHRSVLADFASGQPLISFEKKMFDAHDTWVAYRGEGVNPEDVLFTVQRSSAMQLLHTELDVRFAGNTSGAGDSVGDVKIVGNFKHKACLIISGDSGSALLAQMGSPDEIGGSSAPAMGRGSGRRRREGRRAGRTRGFSLEVYPNTDVVFVAALMLIRREYHKENAKMVIAGFASGGVHSAAAAAGTAVNMAITRLT